MPFGRNIYLRANLIYNETPGFHKPPAVRHPYATLRLFPFHEV